jgi:hypothetical protein
VGSPAGQHYRGDWRKAKEEELSSERWWRNKANRMSSEVIRLEERRESVKRVKTSIVLGIVFVNSVHRDLVMPDFDATLLGLMGLSSGTYTPI